MHTHKHTPYTHRTHLHEKKITNKTLIYNISWSSDGSFLRTLATSLIDFNELSSVAALSQLLEVGPKKKVLFFIFIIMHNKNSAQDHSSGRNVTFIRYFYKTRL